MITVVGIDPGSTSATGFCSLSADETGSSPPIVNVVFSAYGDEALKRSILNPEKRSEIDRRFDGFGRIVETFVRMESPDMVVCESPYFRRIPLPYGRLMQLNMVLRLFSGYGEPNAHFESVTPSQAKSNIKVQGNSGDKELIKKSLLSMFKDGTLLFADDIDIDSIDEHGFDSIAVALYGINVILGIQA